MKKYLANYADYRKSENDKIFDTKEDAIVYALNNSDNINFVNECNIDIVNSQVVCKNNQTIFTTSKNNKGVYYCDKGSYKYKNISIKIKSKKNKYKFDEPYISGVENCELLDDNIIKVNNNYYELITISNLSKKIIELWAINKQDNIYYNNIIKFKYEVE